MAQDRVQETEFGGDYGLINKRGHFDNALETAAELRMIAVMQPSDRPAVLPNPDYQDELAIHDLDRYRLAAPDA